MTGLIFEGRTLPTLQGESILDCLLRHQEPVGSSCRAGVCQSCLVQAKGLAPASAQKGLRPSLVAQNYLLACQCPADAGVELLRGASLPSYPSRVLKKRKLAPDILQIMIERPDELEFRAGQFVSLIRPDDGLTRSYSIASLPTDSAIELQVALLPEGQMGKYLSETPDAPLTLRQPAGECFYLDDKKDEALLLAGTGTGLAPLLGIVRSALQAKHQGPITLFHGAKDKEGLYFRDELHALSQEHELFSYEENVLPPPASSPSKAETPGPDLLAQVKGSLPKLDGYRVYLCGNPDFVHKMKKQCFLAGAAMQSIHSDPFILASKAPLTT